MLRSDSPIRLYPDVVFYSLFLYILIAWFLGLFFLSSGLAEVLRNYNAYICSGVIHGFGENTQYWHHGTYRCWQNNNYRTHALLFWKDI